MNTVKNFPTIHLQLNRCVGSCNTLNGLSHKVYFPNKAEDLNLGVFNMITGINERKRLIKQISCECKSKVDGTKCNSNQWWNDDKCGCQYKAHYICEKE